MGKRILEDSAVHHGLNLAYYRSRRGWTQAEVAEKTGFSQREISKHEHQGLIGDDILQVYANVYKTDIFYLRDTASYTSPGDSYFFNYDHWIQNNYNPVDALKEMHESTVAKIIEANNKHTYSLEKQIEELKAQLKNQ